MFLKSLYQIAYKTLMTWTIICTEKFSEPKHKAHFYPPSTLAPILRSWLKMVKKKFRKQIWNFWTIDNAKTDGRRINLTICCYVQYPTVQYSIVQYSTVQYSTVQYSMYCTPLGAPVLHDPLHGAVMSERRGEKGDWHTVTAKSYPITPLPACAIQQYGYQHQHSIN